MSGVAVTDDLDGVIFILEARAGSSPDSQNRLVIRRTEDNKGNPAVSLKTTNGNWSDSHRWFTLDTIEELAVSLLVMVQQMREEM